MSTETADVVAHEPRPLLLSIEAAARCCLSVEQRSMAAPRGRHYGGSHRRPSVDPIQRVGALHHRPARRGGTMTRPQDLQRGACRIGEP